MFSLLSADWVTGDLVTAGTIQLNDGLQNGLNNDAAGGGPSVRDKQKRNCHFCGYNRESLGLLLSCESCRNMFHASCFPPGAGGGRAGISQALH